MHHQRLHGMAVGDGNCCLGTRFLRVGGPAMTRLRALGTAAEWLNDFATGIAFGAVLGIIYAGFFIFGPALMGGM
jgi:hypothetical protein